MEKRRKTTDRFLCFLGSSDVVSVPDVSETVNQRGPAEVVASPRRVELISASLEHYTHSVSRPVIFISGSKSR